MARDLWARYIRGMIKAVYPKTLHHKTPGWVTGGSVFHIRIRCKATSKELIDPPVAEALLASVEHYVSLASWSSYLFLLMPDHLHALMSFSNEKSMGRIIADWKGYHSKTLGIVWQDNFFDHRIRTHQEFSEKFQYIQMNPVVKGLCKTTQEWSWQSVSSGALARF